MRSAIGKAIILGVAMAAASFAGCSSTSSKEPASQGTENTGDIGLQLQVGGVTVNTVHYTITNNGGVAPQNAAPYVGDINVADASVLSAAIGGLAAGSGYVLHLSATATDGTTMCTGQASGITVPSHASVTVGIELQCKRTNNIGTVVINGSTNECPIITSVSADAPSGNTIQLHGAFDDPDGTPDGGGAAGFTWTTSSGVLSGANTANPVLNCSAAGPANVTAAYTDGDPGCGDTFTLTVNCTVAGPVPEPQPEAGPPDVVTPPEAEAAPPPISCLTGNGACNTCEADPNNCPHDVNFQPNCSDFASGADQMLCAAVFQCVRNSTCYSNPISCLCGTATASTCAASANGPCETQILAGLKTNSVATAIGIITDVTLPGGAAMALLGCDQAACPGACIPYVPAGQTCQ